MAIPRERWEWFGGAGHFIAGSDCRFTLSTRVGSWWVSTVGDYYPAGRDPGGPREVGYGRLYETMVFRIARCKCGSRECQGWRQADGSNVDFAPANTAAEARANHLKLCAKWARKAQKSISTRTEA